MSLPESRLRELEEGFLEKEEEKALAIPGYYFDAKLNRYFKITKDAHLNNKIQNKTKNHPAEKPEEKNREKNIKEHIVTSLRNRASQLETTQSSINFLKEHLIGQVITGGVAASLEIYNCSIKDIKFDNEGTILAVYSVNIYSRGSDTGTHQKIYFFKFTSDQCSNITGHFTDCSPSFYSEPFQQERYNRLSNFHYDRDDKLQEIITFPSTTFFNLHSHGSATILNDTNVNSYAIGSNDVRYFGLTNGKVLRTGLSFLPIDRVQCAPRGVSINDIVTLSEDIICCGCDNGRVYVYDYNSFTTKTVLVVPSFGRSKSRIVRLHVVSKGQQLITSAMNSQLHLWDVSTGCIVHQFLYHSNCYSFTSSIVDTQESFLAVACDRNEIRFWSLSSGQLIYILKDLEESGPRPVISHTHHLVSKNGPPCFIIGQGKKLLLYSLKTYSNIELTSEILFSM